MTFAGEPTAMQLSGMLLILMEQSKGIVKQRTLHFLPIFQAELLICPKVAKAKESRLPWKRLSCICLISKLRRLSEISAQNRLYSLEALPVFLHIVVFAPIQCRGKEHLDRSAATLSAQDFKGRLQGTYKHTFLLVFKCPCHELLRPADEQAEDIIVDPLTYLAYSLALLYE